MKGRSQDDVYHRVTAVQGRFKSIRKKRSGTEPGFLTADH